jgi:hypothetical protein
LVNWKFLPGNPQDADEPEGRFCVHFCSFQLCIFNLLLFSQGISSAFCPGRQRSAFQWPQFDACLGRR